MPLVSSLNMINKAREKGEAVKQAVSQRICLCGCNELAEELGVWR